MQKFLFAGFPVCDIDYFGICVFPFMFCIFANKGSQSFCNELKYQHDALITQYASAKMVHNPLMLTYMMA